jgi:hypothetical protein
MYGIAGYLYSYTLLETFILDQDLFPVQRITRNAVLNLLWKQGKITPPEDENCLNWPFKFTDRWNISSHHLAQQVQIIYLS